MCTFWRVAALRHFDVYILSRVANLSLLSPPLAFFPLFRHCHCLGHARCNVFSLSFSSYVFIFARSLSQTYILSGSVSLSLFFFFLPSFQGRSRSESGRYTLGILKYSVKPLQVTLLCSCFLSSHCFFLSFLLLSRALKRTASKRCVLLTLRRERVFLNSYETQKEIGKESSTKAKKKKGQEQFFFFFAVRVFQSLCFE